MSVNFITFNMLNRVIVDNLYKIPHDIDLIVGIPRSGLLAANIIACHLNKPLTDVDGLLTGKIFQAGFTKNKRGWIDDVSSARKILVVEDSVMSGQSLMTMKKRLQNFDAEIIYLSIIVAPHSANLPDIFFAVVPSPRVFEWNYMHHTLLRRCCVDMDGVLCQDPTPAQNDDGERYRDFCLNAIPKFIPSQPIGFIVTARLQKYAAETEKWLAKHKVPYDNLIMLNLDSAEERRRLGIHANFKAQVYNAIGGAELFIESDFEQAKTIAALTNKDVFCVENSIIVRGGALLQLKITFFCLSVMFCFTRNFLKY